MTPYEKLAVPFNERRKIEKKILPEFYKEVRTHRKTFEIRKDEDSIDVEIFLFFESGTEKSTQVI